MDLTPDNLAKAEFRGPVAFYDGRDGMARQDFECVSEPRFGYAWQRKNSRDKGRQFYMVDGQEVRDLNEACERLSKPADPDSPKERMKRSHEEFMASPPLNYGATRASSEARCNAASGPYASVRPWIKRADNAWHVGINRYADDIRKDGEAFPRWLYNCKSAAHETYRAMYLFEADRKADTELTCALGTRCRDCPILANIEAAMTSKGRDAIEAADIDAAKTWTCIGHILTDGQDVIDGAFFWTKNDRDGM